MFISLLGYFSVNNPYRLLHEGSYQFAGSLYAETLGAYDITSYFTGAALLIFGLLVILWVPILSVSRIQVGGYRPEVYALVVILLLSCGSLVCSSSILVTILSLELLSFSSYVLVAGKLTLRGAIGGWLYAISGGLMSLFTLLGGVVLISSGGSPSYGVQGYYFSSNLYLSSALPVAGALLLVFGFLFKLAAAPYYNWAPDVYASAPTAITALFLTIVKFSVFVAFFRLILFVFYPVFDSLCRPIILFAGCLSLLVGSIGGLRQTQIKRVIAYSSITHVGFVLVGLAQLSHGGLIPALVYLLVYVFTNLGIFIVLVCTLRDTASKGSIVYITDLSVLRYGPAVYLICFVSMIFSLLGLPPFAGFFAKYGVLSNLLMNGCWWLALLVVFSAAVSAAYYLRLIQLAVFGSERVPGYSALDPIAEKYAAYRSPSTIFRVFTWLGMLLSVLLFTLPLLPFCCVDSVYAAIAQLFSVSSIDYPFNRLVYYFIVGCQASLFVIYLTLTFWLNGRHSDRSDRVCAYFRYIGLMQRLCVVISCVLLFVVIAGGVSVTAWGGPSQFFWGRYFPTFFELKSGEWWLLQFFPV